MRTAAHLVQLHQMRRIRERRCDGAYLRVALGAGLLPEDVANARVQDCKLPPIVRALDRGTIFGESGVEFDLML
jgi:hypothetical protein